MVITKGNNIEVPLVNAGIGDLIYKSSGGAYKVIACGTANASTLTIGGTSYTLWGCIYGFVAGMAMVCAPTETSAYWAASGVSCSIGPEYGAGTVLMRNGLKTNYYVQMNTARQMSSDSYRGTAGSNVHPTAAYNGGVMTESTFNANTNNVKNFYGSWKEYLRQTLRVNGAPGTPFGAKFTDGSDKVKVHEFGRWMTRKVYASTETKTNFPAIKYCYEYTGALSNDATGTWWLPSMFELAELLIDEHLDKVNDNTLTGWTDVNTGSDRWSCVRVSSTTAWGYDRVGLSSYTGMSNYQLTVRPVTLLKLK